MTLRRYILKRLIWSIFVLWLVATLNFVLIGMDPVAQYGTPWAAVDPAILEPLIKAYGGHGSMFIRYIFHLRNMFTYGLVFPYFGWSTYDRNFVAFGLARRLPLTLCLMGTALAITVTIGILIGMLAASKRGTRTDRVITFLSLLMWTVPIMIAEFLVIILFSYLFIVHGIKIFPVTGLTSASPYLHNAGFALYLDIAWHLCLPVACLVVVGLGPWVLYTKNMMTDALTQDYIFYTARAKGLSQKIILFKHAFKSILPQISTMVATATPAIIAGSMITEALFGLDGIGNWYIKVVYADAQIIRFTDPAVTQAVFFIYAHIVIALNFIADLLYGVFDPRIRVGTRR